MKILAQDFGMPSLHPERDAGRRSGRQWWCRRSDRCGLAWGAGSGTYS